MIVNYCENCKKVELQKLIQEIEKISRDDFCRGLDDKMKKEDERLVRGIRGLKGGVEVWRRFERVLLS